MQETYICLQTEHVDKFRCDGRACQSKCCRAGWNIAIDEDAWKKYKKIKAKDIRKGILSNIKKKEGTRYIKLRPDGGCPFLREDFLCGLQRDYGEAYLSSVCRTHPRRVRLLGDFMERSLALTCPLAAKQVLLPREPMTFEQREVALEGATYVGSLARRKGTDRLPEIQYAAISLLQNRKYTIDQRLILLGFFVEQLQELEEEKWEGMIRLYASEEIDAYAPRMLHAISFQPEQYLKMMFGVIEDVYGEKSDLHIWSDYLGYVTRVFGLDGERREVPMDELVCAYEDRYPRGKGLLIGGYSHVLENYLVNDFFGYMYPFAENGNYAQNYRVFLLGYKLLEFLMIAAAAETGEKFGEDVFLPLMMAFSQWIDHAPKFRNHFIKRAMDCGEDLPPFMACLLQAGEVC